MSYACPVFQSLHRDKVSSALASQKCRKVAKLRELFSLLNTGELCFFRASKTPSKALAREIRSQITQRHLGAHGTARCSVSSLVPFPGKSHLLCVTLFESKNERYQI